MKKTIKLTAKRQATFPAEVCEQIGLQPGDEIDLLPRIENGEQVWLLQKHRPPARPWICSLRAHAGKVKDHSIEAIRASVAAGRGAST